MVNRCRRLESSAGGEKEEDDGDRDASSASSSTDRSVLASDGCSWPGSGRHIKRASEARRILVDVEQCSC